MVLVVITSDRENILKLYAESFNSIDGGERIPFRNVAP